MNEPIAPSVTLGGRVWNLRMTHRVLMLFSSATKLSLDQLMNQIGRYDYMILLLWLMIQQEDSQLKRQTFEGWLDDLGVANIVPLLTAVGEAMQAAFPDAAEAADGETGGETGEAGGETGNPDPT